MSEDSEKELGNAAFRREDYETAFKHYDNAIRNAGSGAYAALFSNKAAALLKLEKYDLGIEQCWKGLVAPGLTPELKAKIYSRLAFAYNMIVFKLMRDDSAAKKFLFGCLDNDTIQEVAATVGEKALRYFSVVKPAVKLSRSELITEHNAFLQTCKTVSLSPRGFLPINIEAERIAAFRSSKADLRDLKPISIGELRSGEVNVGKMLICRTITEPVLVMTSLITLIEDPMGEVTRLAVYNVPPGEDWNTILPVGTYFAVKEPTYAKEGFADGSSVLRVYCPLDLPCLERTGRFLSDVKWRTNPPSGGPDSWESFRNRGNELFVAGSFGLAITAYSDAIEMKRIGDRTGLADILANRAAAYMAAGKPMDGFWDCSSALYLEPGHLKAAMRLAKARASLGKYEEAKDGLANCPHATKPIFQAEISRLGRLLREQQNGEYDLKVLLKEAAASNAPRLDHADYNGGVSKQWISQTRGNGLIALRDFAPGDLLFVSKAFVATYRSDADVGTGYFFPNDQSQDACACKIVGRVEKNPDLVKELFQLYAGPDFERFDEPEPGKACKVYFKRVAAIVELNAFGSADFVTNISGFSRVKIGSAGAGFVFSGCGVWILAAFMNHSCLPNTIIFYVGDLMIARARKAICKGEELTTSYSCVPSDCKIRQEALKKFGFKCDCSLCVCDFKQAVCQPYLDAQREAFVDSFFPKLRLLFNEVSDNSKSVATAVEDVRKLAEDFSSRLAYKNRYDSDLEGLYTGLGFIYSAQREWLKAAKAYEMAYMAVVGNPGTHSIVNCNYNTWTKDSFVLCFNTATNYLLCRNGKAKDYLSKAQAAAKIAWGSADIELLQMLYPNLPIENTFKSLN